MSSFPLFRPTVTDHTARRFARHALAALVLLWGISALTTLLPRL